MSFSGITVEQRSKEVEALKSFLTYSLIGSLALHIGVLSSGISNYLTRVPTGEEEPIEVAIVDSPTAEPEKPIADIPEEIKKEPEVVQKQPIETLPVEKIQQQEQITAIAQKLQPTNTPPKAIATKPEVPVKSAPIPRSAPEVPVKSASIPRSLLSGDSKASSAGGGGGGGGGGGSGVGLGSGSGIAVGTSSGTGPGGGTGTGTGGGIGSGTGSGIGSGTGSGIGSGTGSGIGSGTGSGIGSGSGSGIGSGTGSGIGSGSGSGIGNGVGNRPTVATAPTAATPPKINSPGNGRAACRECNAKYPEAARRRGVEGRVEVAVDTDAQGNVTNVRIARSSGNRDLDEETARQAREWKLKPAEGGRQGVSIATEFAIKGSQRSRQVQERQAQREAQERTQQTTAANSTEESPRRRRRELPPSSNEARATKPAISGFSRRLEPQRRESPSRNSSSEARTTRTQESARDSLRRIRRERTVTDSSQKPQATTNRRRRDNTSQNKLRESLRRLRQQPQSQPAAPSQQ
ncbi:MAG: TonB family protein [Nostoc sp.]|uniref:TonB family protein n=1 Tax=unclassified Nostoc TaxID=2593658 RepID=UPI001DA566EE|nr:TonB family protein [Nostoc sp. JL34]MBN3885966.1 TonB family protein [Nostoc sp. JL34]